MYEYAGLVLVVDYDSYQVVHSVAHWVVVVFLAIRVYILELWFLIGPEDG